jgi:hypothetical protein
MTLSKRHLRDKRHLVIAGSAVLTAYHGNITRGENSMFMQARHLTRRIFQHLALLVAFAAIGTALQAAETKSLSVSASPNPAIENEEVTIKVIAKNADGTVNPGDSGTILMTDYTGSHNVNEDISLSGGQTDLVKRFAAGLHLLTFKGTGSLIAYLPLVVNVDAKKAGGVK